MAYQVGTQVGKEFYLQTEILDKPPKWGDWIELDGQTVRWNSLTEIPHPSEKVPQKIQIGKKLNILPDLFDIEGGWCVSQTFKDILENLEPNVHQFFPLEVTRRDGGPGEGSYYLLVVCHLLDTALVPEQSSVIKKVASEEFNIYHYTHDGSGLPRYTLNKRVIGNRHAWIDKRMSGAFFSDSFMQRIAQAGLTGINAEIHTTDIDE